MVTMKSRNMADIADSQPPKERQRPKCKVPWCESRHTVCSGPFLCAYHFHEMSLFTAGYRTKSGHNWWAPDGDGARGVDDHEETMKAYFQYITWDHEGKVSHEKWAREEAAKKAEPVATSKVG